MPKSRKNNRLNHKKTSEDVENEVENKTLNKDLSDQLCPIKFELSSELTSLLETTPEKRKNPQEFSHLSDEEDCSYSHFEEPEQFCKRLLENLEKINSIGVDSDELIEVQAPKPTVEIREKFGRSKSENHIVKIQGVNLNPYFKYDNLIIKSNKDNKENSVNELSFFTPELLRAKHASTPINNNRLRIPIQDITNSKYNFCRVKQNLHRTQFRDGRISKLSRTAPAILHTLKNGDYSRCSNNSIKLKTSGTLKQLVEKCRTTTGKWALGLLSLCSTIGNRLKSSFSRENSDFATCHQEIVRLNTKIEDLSDSLKDIKTILCQSLIKRNDVSFEDISNELRTRQAEIEELKRNSPCKLNKVA